MYEIIRIWNLFLDLPGFYPMKAHPGLGGRDFNQHSFVSYKEQQKFEKDDKTDLNYLVKFSYFDFIDILGKKVWLNEHNLYFVLTMPHEVSVDQHDPLSTKLFRQIEEGFLKDTRGEAGFEK